MAPDTVTACAPMGSAISEPPASDGAAACANCGTWCPVGLHDAKVEITSALAPAYSRNRSYAHHFGFAYPDFSTEDQCMRYFLQYMPLHTPQIDSAISTTFEHFRPAFGPIVRVLDIGGGPGTLLASLAGLAGRNSPIHGSESRFEVNQVEPAAGFAKFVYPVAHHLNTPQVRFATLVQCHLHEALDSHPHLAAGANWIVLANALTPLIRHSSPEGVAALVQRAATLALDQCGRVVVTVIENGGGSVALDLFALRFIPLCSGILRDQLFWNGSVSAPHLSLCKFFVTKYPSMTQPRLKFLSLLLERPAKG